MVAVEVVVAGTVEVDTGSRDPTKTTCHNVLAPTVEAAMVEMVVAAGQVEAMEEEEMEEDWVVAVKAQEEWVAAGMEVEVRVAAVRVVVARAAVGMVAVGWEREKEAAVMGVEL